MKQSLNQKWRMITGLIALSLCAVFFMSCTTTGVGYFRGASVVVKGFALSEVKNAVIDEFDHEDYRLAASPVSNALRFEKKGTKHDEIMYSTWRLGVTTQRAEVSFENLGDQRIRVTCSAYIVRDEGGMGGEEKGLLWANGRGRFQGILNQAVKRLKKERKQEKKKVRVTDQLQPWSE